MFVQNTDMLVHEKNYTYFLIQKKNNFLQFAQDNYFLVLITNFINILVNNFVEQIVAGDSKVLKLFRILDFLLFLVVRFSSCWFNDLSKIIPIPTLKLKHSYSALIL